MKVECFWEHAMEMEFAANFEDLLLQAHVTSSLHKLGKLGLSCCPAAPTILQQSLCTGGLGCECNLWWMWSHQTALCKAMSVPVRVWFEVATGFALAA